MSPKKRAPKKSSKSARPKKAAPKKSSKKPAAKKKPTRRAGGTNVATLKNRPASKASQVALKDTLGEWNEAEEVDVRDDLSEDDDFLDIGGSE